MPRATWRAGILSQPPATELNREIEAGQFHAAQLKRAARRQYGQQGTYLYSSSAKEEQQELEALHRLDEECVYQQQAVRSSQPIGSLDIENEHIVLTFYSSLMLAQGNYLKAFDCMERALVLRRHFFGAESSEVLHACKALAEMCNLLAMSFLQQDLLKKAEILTKHHASEKATTLNNLACYYRRLGKLHAAMTCLKRALEIEKKLQSVRNAADTHLNLCAVLSQLGKHQQALEQAQEALIILQEEFFQAKQTVIDKASASSKKNVHEAESDKATASSQQLDRVSVMCIAYHNIGVEQEFLKDYANSVVSYKKGVGLAEQYLGVDHAITTTVRNSYLAAKRTISTKSATSKRGCQQSGAVSPLATSPGKASTRLINSPRSNGSSLTNSLRRPSPLSKEKQFHNLGEVPSPRSIVADVLAKGATLPPLDTRSPSRGILSPRDPFFSPRFRFDGGNDTGAGGVGKSSGSVTKKKQKEVKFQPPVAAEVAQEPPISANNSSLSGPAVEFMIPEMEPASPLVEERSSFNQEVSIPSQALNEDFQEPASLVANSLETSGEWHQDSVSGTQDEDMRSPASLNAGQIIETESETPADANDESLPSEAEQHAGPSITEENEPVKSSSPQEAEAERVGDTPQGTADYSDISPTDDTSDIAASIDADAAIESAELTDPSDEAILLSRDPECLREIEVVPTNGEIEISPEFLVATDHSPIASPEDFSFVDAGEDHPYLGEAVAEVEKIDKETILGLLNESTGYLHLTEGESDISEPSEIPANPTDPDAAAEIGLETNSTTEPSGVKNSDKVEASGSAQTPVHILEDSVLQEEEEVTVATEDSPLALDQSLSTNSEPIVQMPGEEAGVNEPQDLAEGSVSEVADSEAQFYDEEGGHSLPEDHTAPTWAAEDNHDHLSEAYEECIPAANEGLHPRYDDEVAQLCEIIHPDEQPVLESDDSSGLVDVSRHEEFAPEAELYHHEGFDTPEYSEYHHQVDTEDNSVEAQYERHLTPDPEYDDQFEHDPAAAAEPEGDLSNTFHDLRRPISSEYPPDDSAFYPEDDSQATFGDSDTAVEGFPYDEQPSHESALAPEHQEVDSSSPELIEAASHDNGQDEEGDHVGSSQGNTIEL